MPNFQYVGQDVGSADCGFFSGYVVGLFKRHRNFDQMVMTQQDVYAARNAFKGCDHSGASTEWLVPSETSAYLEKLGVRGQAAVMPNQRDAAAILKLLLELLSRDGCCGVMIAQMGQLYHWVAVLGGNNDKMVVYDPGHRRDGVHAQVVKSQSLSAALANNGVGGMVSGS